MADRKTRLAYNETLFRALNERLAEVLEEIGDTADRFEIICECGNSDCTAKIVVGKVEYERVRRHPERFLVAVDHVIPEVEGVVSAQDEYAVVEKHLEEGLVARATDPRA
jgi:hypothetical protein